MSKVKLIGFKVESVASARCPNGHEYRMTLTNLIPATDNFDVDSHTESIKRYLKIAYKDLCHTTICQECEKEKNTFWR